MSVEFSVVIPSHNRKDVLPEVLEAVEQQEVDFPFELLVVDDGSSDGTAEWLKARSFRLPGRVLLQENRGPAAARNAGVAAAQGRWLAFLGDDTVPSPGWLQAHHDAHRRHPDEKNLAVIGYTRWHPRMRRTPFLDYINEYGLQFGYALIEDPEDVPFNFLYTSNLSMGRHMLVAEPFDLSFPYPAWEDIEAGYRLKEKGMRLMYEPSAVVLHDHPTSFERFCQRQEKAGYSAVVFYGLHPELGGFLGVGPEGPPSAPEGWRIEWMERLARTLQRFPVKLPKLWEDVLRRHYIQGLQRGWRDQAHQRKGEMR